MNLRRGIRVTVEVGDGSREVHEVIGTSSDTVETRSESGAGDTFMRSTMTSADGTSRILGITEGWEPKREDIRWDYVDGYFEDKMFTPGTVYYRKGPDRRHEGETWEIKTLSNKVGPHVRPGDHKDHSFITANIYVFVEKWRWVVKWEESGKEMIEEGEGIGREKAFSQIHAVIRKVWDKLSSKPSVAGSAHEGLKGLSGISSKILKMVEEIEPKKSR